MSLLNKIGVYSSELMFPKLEITAKQEQNLTNHSVQHRQKIALVQTAAYAKTNQNLRLQCPPTAHGPPNGNRPTHLSSYYNSIKLKAPRSLMLVYLSTP